MDCNEKELQELIAAGFQNQNMDIEDLRDILERVRQHYDLDMVFVASNRDYKYELALLTACGRPGLEQEEPESIRLTKAQYAAIVESYRDAPVCEGAAIPGGCPEDSVMLRAELVHKGQYFGIVAFRAALGHVWTSGERETLSMLSSLTLMYLAISRLDPNGENTVRVEECFQDEDVLSCYYLDMRSGECHSVKLADYMKPYFGDWCGYSEMLRIYTGQLVDPIYGSRLQQEFGLESLRKQLTERKRQVSMQFPRIVGEKARWLRYAVEALNFIDGVPESAVVTFDDVTEEAQQSAYLAHDCKADRSSYVLISGLDLDTMRCGIYVDNRTPEQDPSPRGFGGSYEATVDYLTGLIPEGMYRKRFTKLFSVETIASSFENNPEGIFCDLPCEQGHTTSWLRIEGMRAHDFAEGNRHVILYFGDITAQKERERELHEANDALEMERERVIQQQQQLFYDPLTGAINRAGFERRTVLAEESEEPLGFMMVDIDNFKELNDSFGHEYGDRALVEVSSLLKSTFRSEDKIFRMGGDEFAVMLCGCGNDAWASIRAKVEAMQTKLEDVARDGSSITISCGLAISDKGYNKDLARLADEALYNTKRNGRAGITQVGQDGKVLNFWHDLSAFKAGAETHSDIAKWRIEYPGNGKKPRLIMYHVSRALMAIPEVYSPEECYEQWAERISPRHREFMRELSDRVSATGIAEGTYCWEHPTHGELLLRSSMKLDESSEEPSIYGYTVPLKESSVIYSHDDGQFLMQAMNSIFYCSYYINVRSRDYYITKGHEDEPDVDELHIDIDSALGAFVDAYVHPDFRDLVREFIDFDTIEERFKDELYLDCEYLSLMKYGWVRSRLLPVKWDAEGRLTHVLLSSGTIDKKKRRELKREHEMFEVMRIQQRIAEVVSKSKIFQTALVNKETGEAEVWNYSLVGEKGEKFSFEDMKRWGLARVCEQDASNFEREYDFARVLAKVEEDGEFTLAFRARGLDDKMGSYLLHYASYDADPAKLILVVEVVSGLKCEQG